MSIENKAFSNKPDYSVNSTTPVETAEELISFDKKMGGVSINKKTYKIFRFIRFPICDGISPDRLFSYNSNLIKLVNCPI